MGRHPPRLTLGLVALILLLAACSGGAADDANPNSPDFGPSRTFAMGLSSLPPELTEESYENTFSLASGAGEVILLQRRPPWEELLEGDVSEETVQTTQLETALAEEQQLDVFFAIDPIDVTPEGIEITGLPAGLAGAAFGDEEVRTAFIAYARYVAVNYTPKYLALGVEVNSYQAQNPEDFENFVTLYHEAYEAVRDQSPDTLVFPTFQMEELLGLLGEGEDRMPQWQLLRRFEPRLDLLAVSTFPSSAFDDPSKIPADYYEQLAAHTDRPVAISEMGYASGGGENGRGLQAEADQASFLKRALEDAQELEMPLVVWFVGHDATYVGEPPFDALRHIGLLREDGTRKEAWTVWAGFARRALDEAPADKAAKR